MGIVKWMILVIVAIVGFNYYQKQTTEWREVVSDQGAFSVSMPGRPTLELQKEVTVLGQVDIPHYVVEQNGLGYMAGYADFPTTARRTGSDSEVLDGASSGVVKGARGTLLSESRIRYGHHPGRELRIEATRDNRKYTVHLRVYLAGNRIYQLGVFVPEGAEATDATRFLGSFKLLGE